MWRKTVQILQMIKFEHSVFALPFAVSSALYAAPDAPLAPMGWILLAMVSARSASMAFNRIVDASIDAKNPRTADRHIPTRAIRPVEAWIFTLIMIGVFFLAAGMLNRTCLYCAPGVLVILFGYSYTKRFTWLCHFVLGISLGLAPVGAWIGITNDISIIPVLLGASVVFWVAGFDIIYACLDAEFDRREGIKSIPARFGVRNGLILSSISHVLCAAALLAIYFYLDPKGTLYLAIVIPILLILAYQHLIVKPTDLGRANIAFFNVNVIVSLGVMTALLLDLYAG